MASTTILFATGLAIIGVALTGRAASLDWGEEGSGGSGDWNLVAENWWDGAINVVWPDEGEAVFGGSAGTVDVANVTAGRLSFNTEGYALQNGSVTLQADGGNAPVVAVYVPRPGEAVVGSALAGLNGVDKHGPGVAVFSGNNTYTGDTVVRQGLLVLASPSGDIINGDIILDGGRILLGGEDQIQNGAILYVGSHRLQMQGYDAVIGGVQSFQGDSTTPRIVEAARDGMNNAPATLTIDVAADEAYSFDGYVRDAAGATNSPLSIIKAGPGTQVFSGPGLWVSYSGDTVINEGILEFGGSGLSANSVITLHPAGTVRFNTSEDAVYDNIITGAGRLEKSGATRLELRGEQTYTGTTTVTGGILELNGSTHPDSVVIVADGGALGGSGSIGGETIVQSGGEFLAEKSAGLLLSDTIFESKSVIRWAFSDQGYGRIVAAEDASVSFPTGVDDHVILRIEGNIGDLAWGNTYEIFDGGIDGFDVDRLVIDDQSGWIEAGYEWEISPDGLRLTPVPVPDLTDTLRINEVMASNGETLADADGDYEDWIELYNYGDAEISLGGWGLSDDFETPFRWVIPWGTVIEPGEYFVVFASGKDRRDPGGELHTNFSVSSGGEEVLLTRPDGVRVDEMPPVRMRRDTSYGRVEGDWFYFAEPTPGAANTSTPYKGILEPVEFSQTGGFHFEDFNLILSHPDPEAVIVYTRDGSEPDTNNLRRKTYGYKNHYPQQSDAPLGPMLYREYRSHEYHGGIHIYDRTQEENQVSAINARWTSEPQLPDEPVFKGTPVRARAVAPDMLPSVVTTHTYFVHPEMGERFDQDILSIVTAEKNLFGYEEGIYVAGKLYDDDPSRRGTSGDGNYRQKGREWERPVHVELLSQGSGERSFAQNLGLRVHGGSSRIRTPRSLRLYARNAYDDRDVMAFPFFEGAVSKHDGTPLELFTRVNLRTGGHIRDHLRDVPAHLIMESTEVDMMRSRPVIHFFNGEYMGASHVRDRFDRYHLQHNYGVDTDNVIILNGPNTPVGTSRLDEGVPEDLAYYNDMWDFVVGNDMRSQENYAQLSAMLDIDSYIDLQIVFVYLNNWDWRGVKHFRMWRVRETSDQPYQDGRWRVHAWDFDASPIAPIPGNVFADFDFDLVINIIHPTGGGNGWTHGSAERTLFLRTLLENETFYNRFLNRFADHINTTFHPRRVKEIVNLEYDKIVGHNAMFRNSFHRDLAPLSTYQNWLTFADVRPGYVRQQIETHFNLAGQVQLTVDTELPEGVSDGHIRVNTVDIHSGTPGVGTDPFPWTGTYFKGVPVELEAHAPDGFRFVGWAVQGEEGVHSDEPVISLELEVDRSLTAVFEEVPLIERPIALHVWDFESASGYQEPSFTVGGGALSAVPGPATVVERNDPAQGFETAHLRVNDPLGAIVEFNLPTSGFEDIVLDFDTRRSGQGAGRQTLSYTVDGNEWIERATYTVFNTDPQSKSFDFSGIGVVDDNVDFAVRITFDEEDGGTSGNNRFDDVVLSGVALPGTAVPPVVVKELEFQQLIEDGPPFMVDMEGVFAHPRELPMTFSACTDNADVVTVTVSGAEVTVAPGQPGVAVVTLTADDGEQTHVSVSFQVSVAPDGVPLFLPGGDGAWALPDNWSTTAYPDGVGAPGLILAPAGGNRNVDIDRSVTIGRLTVDNGVSADRNRIRAVGGEGKLIFEADEGPAQLIIEGSGSGFAEFRSDTSFVLADDLRVNVSNVNDNHGLEGIADDYGALRFRDDWSGTGGLIKTGAGVMSLTGGGKEYQGATVVEKGVLRITEPAAPSNSSGVVVKPGGQLRLVSAGDRVYPFGGDIALNSMGRGGEVSEGQLPGALGGLRYDPGSGGNRASLANSIVFTGASGLHVEGPANAMRLSGPLSGPGGLHKSGLGTLLLESDSPGYTSTIEVGGGELRVGGVLGAAIDVLHDSSTGMAVQLRGSGTVGALSGVGIVSPGPGIAMLTAASVEGLNYRFVAGGDGSDILRLTASSPIAPMTSANTIHAFFDVEEWTGNEVFDAGFFTDSADDFSTALSDATWAFYVRTAGGGIVHDGVFYEPLAGVEPAWRVVRAERDFGGEVIEGRQLRLGAMPDAPGVIGAWIDDNFSADEVTDASVSGMLAVPEGSRIPNLLRYALGLQRNDDCRAALPMLQVEGGTINYSHRRLLAEDRGIDYLVEISLDLTDWRAIEEDVRLISQTTRQIDDDTVEVVDYELDFSAGDASVFLRLRVIVGEQETD